MTQQTSGVHATGLIHGVPPDVEDRLGGPNDPADQWPHRHADPEHEVVEGVLIYVVQLVVELRGEVNQVTKVIVRIVLQKY